MMICKTFSGIYKPVEYWQLQEQNPPAKRHQGSSVFTLKEMEAATKSFSNENFVGKGGFGWVYKGTLRSGEVWFRVWTLDSRTLVFTKTDSI